MDEFEQTPQMTVNAPPPYIMGTGVVIDYISKAQTLLFVKPSEMRLKGEGNGLC